MSEPDVVAELDALGERADPDSLSIIARARAEIVALRQQLGDAIDPRRDFQMAAAARRLIRAEALEEAARVCEGEASAALIAHSVEAQYAGEQCAAAIRALKDKP